MQVTGLNFSKTIQTAQYEPETLEAHAVMEDGDDFETCAANLRSRVTKAMGRKAVGPSIAANEGAKTPAKKAAATKPKTAAKPKAKKPIAYNREVKAHAAEMGKVLHEVCPDWKASAETKAKAKAASTSLTGTDFMDAEGKVLPSFVEAVKEAMTDADL